MLLECHLLGIRGKLRVLLKIAMQFGQEAGSEGFTELCIHQGGKKEVLNLSAGCVLPDAVNISTKSQRSETLRAIFWLRKSSDPCSRGKHCSGCAVAVDKMEPPDSTAR